MALSESSRMDYERHLLEHKPSITDNEARSPDKTALGFDVGAVAGAERLVLKLATDKGTETLSLNPMIAHYLAMLLIKGIQQNEWLEIHVQYEGQTTLQ